jgi:hypothetical protein
MKKVLLLFGIGICCLSAQSQVTFSSPNSSSVTSGTTVTLNSSGESSNAYLSNVASVTTNNSNVTATISNTTYGYSMPNYVTQILVTLNYPSGTGPVPVTLTVNCTLFDGSNDYSEQLTVTPTFNVSPAQTTTTTYWNVAESGTFEKQGCGGGSMGSDVTYTVPAHTYSSTSSQTAANQLAINAVNAGGQSHANTSGTCIPIYARLVGTVNNGEGSNIVAHFYADAACTTPIALPGATNLTVTWTKYHYDGTQYQIASTYAVAQGATTFSIGHREFYTSLPPTTIFIDWVAAVVLETTNPNFTAEPNYGVFTNN